MSRPVMHSPLLAWLFAAALAGAGCAVPLQGPSGAGQAATAATAAATGIATVRISPATLSGLARTATRPNAAAAKPVEGPRAYLLKNNEFRVVELRLTVKGPDVASPTIVTTPWDSRGPLAADGAANPALPGTEWTINVPAGKNRVFTLEGLDRGGHVLASVKAVASLDAGQTATVRFDHLETAIARALESLMAPVAGDEADTAGMATTIATTDLTTPLRTFITARTGYDRATNQYASFLSPRAFRSRRLANHLRQNGVAYLQAPDDNTLSTGASYTITLTVGAHTGIVNAYFGGESTNIGLAPSTVTAGVTPGVYDVAIEVTDAAIYHSWTTITVQEVETPQSFNLTLPALTVTSSLPGPATNPAPVPMTASSGGFVGAVDLARDPRNANLYGVSNTYLYRLDPSGGGYNQPSGTGTLIHSTNLKAVTVDADGDVFVLAQDGKLMMLDKGLNQLVLVAGGADNNYADGVGAAAGLGSEGRLVSPAVGVVYMTDQQASSFRRITFNKSAPGGPTGTVKTLAGYPAGVAGNRVGCKDGRGTAARFEAPSGLARGSDGAFYIAEPSSFAIRKVVLDAAADVGVVSTVAGNHQGYADGTGAQAEFTTLGRNLAIDANNYLYVAQTGASANAIRRIDPATRQVTTLSGGPMSGNFTDPKIVLIEQSGNLLVTDPSTNVKRLNIVGL